MHNDRLPKTGLHCFCEDPKPGFGIGAMAVVLTVVLLIRYPIRWPKFLSTFRALSP